MKLHQLSEMVSKVCPIHGINSVGAISFKDDANQGQRNAAQAIVDAKLSSVSDEPSAQEQIDSLERGAMLPRVVREDLLLRFVMAAADHQPPIPLADLLDVNHADYAPGFAKVYAFNEQVKALRALL